MLLEITEKELPEIFKEAFNNWQYIFRKKVSRMPFKGINWQGEDKNLKAHNSLEEYLTWCCYHTAISEPYRDDGFYSRDFTFLLTTMHPNLCIELGTDKGMGTFMISRLIDPLVFYTIDNREKAPLPGDTWVETGYIAKINDVDANYIIGNSSETKLDFEIDFCFIDADHSEDGVYKDSWWAWNNRNKTKFLILWHDYRIGNPEFDGLIRGVNKFSEEVKWPLYKLKDSSLVWMYRDYSDS